MSVKKNPSENKQRRTIRKRASNEGPLGWLQAKILKKIAVLGDEAYGHMILQVLMHEAMGWIDPSSVYGNIRKLASDGLIEHVGWLPHSHQGPPRKVFRLTEAGHKSLETTIAHYRELLTSLEAPEKSPVTIHKLLRPE